jgi:hypothetical protein
MNFVNEDGTINFFSPLKTSVLFTPACFEMQTRFRMSEQGNTLPCNQLLEDTEYICESVLHTGTTFLYRTCQHNKI